MKYGHDLTKALSEVKQEGLLYVSNRKNQASLLRLIVTAYRGNRRCTPAATHAPVLKQPCSK